MKHRKRFALLTLFACMIGVSGVLSACGGDEDGGDAGERAPQTSSGDRIERNEANAQTSITVGSKNFTEQKVLGEIYAAALSSAGYEVSTELDLGDETTAQRALTRGAIDGYPEYTGTALLSLCDVETDDIPKDEQQAYQDAKACFERDGLVALPPTPFTSSNEVAVTQETADRLDLQAISDLEGKAERLTLYGSPECRQRTDCLLGLRRTYGLDFRRFTPVDIALRHEVLERGDDVVSIVFTTDPQNKREGLVLLDDDKGMFPPYNSTFVVREETAREAGADLPQVIEQVQKGLTDEVMQELNARVDLDKETPRQVAAEYLRESGLVSD
jgi:osmoprotectant transport system substrate-binding protein